MEVSTEATLVEVRTLFPFAPRVYLSSHAPNSFTGGDDDEPLPFDTQWLASGDADEPDPVSEAEEDLAALTLGQLKRVRPETVNYAKRAKRIDVKKLKDTMWKELEEVALPVKRVSLLSSLPLFLNLC